MLRQFLRLLRIQRNNATRYRIEGKREHLRRLFILFGAVIVLHTSAMVLFEDMTWWQGIWLTMTSASTTGYGDISAATVYGQIATIVLIYAFGITLLAQIASEYIEYRIELRERKLKGLWGWKDMQDHIVIVNSPKVGAERYLKNLLQDIREEPQLKEHPVVLLTPDFYDGLPESLVKLGLVHFSGHAEVSEDLIQTGIENAAYILVLASDTHNLTTDSVNYDVISRIREINPNSYLLAECVEDANRSRLAGIGANSVVRPVRAYPEIVVRAMSMPGSERVLENLFTHSDDHTHRFDIQLSQVEWRDVVCKLMQQGYGTAMAYIDLDGKVDTNPKAQTKIDCSALLVLVNHDEIPTIEQVKACLTSEGKP